VILKYGFVGRFEKVGLKVQRLCISSTLFKRGWRMRGFFLIKKGMFHRLRIGK